MKICWDNLEKLRYSKRTEKWYQGSSTYIYMKSCKECGEEYLNNTHKNSLFCSKSCSHKKIIISDKQRKLMINNRSPYNKENNPFYGKQHTEETKKKISNSRKGKTGFNKGGYTSKNIPLYDTYAEQIMFAEPVRRNIDDKNILEVKCTYCGKWYIPKRTEIQNRIQVLNGNYTGEHRLYCSNNCKQECPIYRKIKYSAEESNTKQYSREVQPELRQLVFERDNYECQKCDNKKSLHCHHVEGIRHDPLESADIDKCITLCKDCHKEVHEIEGCKTSDMRCKEIV